MTDEGGADMGNIIDGGKGVRLPLDFENDFVYDFLESDERFETEAQILIQNNPIEYRL